jgi:hypothetical protein
VAIVATEDEHMKISERMRTRDLAGTIAPQPLRVFGKHSLFRHPWVVQHTIPCAAGNADSGSCLCITLPMRSYRELRAVTRLFNQMFYFGRNRSTLTGR